MSIFALDQDEIKVDSTESTSKYSSAKRVGEGKPCDLCGRGPFKGAIGLSQHLRLAHASNWNLGLESREEERKLVRWSDEELHVVCRHYQKLLISGKVCEVSSRATASRLLNEVHPSRSIESFKKLLASQRFKRYLSQLDTNAHHKLAEHISQRHVSDLDSDIQVSPEKECSRVNKHVSDSNIRASPKMENECLELTKELEDSLLSAWDQFDEPLPEFEEKKGLISFAEDEIAKLIDKLEKEPVRDPKPRPVVRGSVNASRKSLRRKYYGRLQEIYKKDRRRASEVVFSRRWAEESVEKTSSVHPDTMMSTWRSVFMPEGIVEEHSAEVGRGSTPSAVVEQFPVEDGSLPSSSGVIGTHSVGVDSGTASSDAVRDLCRPIQCWEIEREQINMSKSACGVDRVKFLAVKQLAPETLCAHYNLWLYNECLPSEMNRGRTILIPKVDDASALEHRPISICSHVTRLFHKILASRLDRAVDLSPSQKGFRKVDGVGANLFILRNLFDHAKKSRKSLAICFLDIKKAFDSVAHDSLLRAMRAKNIPSKLVSYVKNVYKEATTRIEFGGQKSEFFHPTRGVRQGDPLSPILFNMTLDLCFKNLSDKVGFQIGDRMLNHLAYADDTVLIAKTETGLQSLLNEFMEVASGCGLDLNEKKCAALSMKFTPRDRSLFYATKPFLTTPGGLMPILDESKSYKYLGIIFSASRNFSETSEKLQGGLDALTEAPLKPQQRVFLLKHFLVPKILHSLIFSGGNARRLKALDVMIRGAVRSWLKWPRDTPTPMFYCKIDDGGLNLPSLEHAIPIMLRHRLDQLRSSSRSDPTVVALQKVEPARSRLVKIDTPVIRQGVHLRSSEDVQKSFKCSLTQSVDGKGLMEHDGFKPHGFLVNGTRLLSGSMFVKVLKLRGNLLRTRGRTARGQPSLQAYCECCKNVYESLGHILQVCPRTHGSRVVRHDKVLDLATTMLKDFVAKGKLGPIEVMREPRIPTPEGIRKPDLVVRSSGKVYVVDAQVVSDNVSLNEVHRNKIVYYDKPAIRDWLNELEPGKEIMFSSLSLNWRGEIGKSSARFLSNEWKFSKREFELLALRVLEGGVRAYQHFERSTYSIR